MVGVKRPPRAPKKPAFPGPLAGMARSSLRSAFVKGDDEDPVAAGMEEAEQDRAVTAAMEQHRAEVMASAQRGDEEDPAKTTAKIGFLRPLGGLHSKVKGAFARARDEDSAAPGPEKTAGTVEVSLSTLAKSIIENHRGQAAAVEASLSTLAKSIMKNQRDDKVGVVQETDQGFNPPLSKGFSLSSTRGWLRTILRDSAETQKKSSAGSSSTVGRVGGSTWSRNMLASLKMIDDKCGPVDNANEPQTVPSVCQSTGDAAEQKEAEAMRLNQHTVGTEAVADGHSTTAEDTLLKQPLSLLPRDEGMAIQWKQRAFDSSAMQRITKQERVNEDQVKLLLSKLVKLPVESLDDASKKPFIQAQLRRVLNLDTVEEYKKSLFGGNEVYEKPLDAHFIVAVATARKATSDVLREDVLYRQEMARVQGLRLTDPTRSHAMAALKKQKQMISAMQEWAKRSQDTVREMTVTSSMSVPQAVAALSGAHGPAFGELQCQIAQAQLRCKNSLAAAGEMESKTVGQLRDIEVAQTKLDRMGGIWPYAEGIQKVGAEATLIRRKEIVLRGRDWAAAERKSAAAARAEAAKLNDMLILGEFEQQQQPVDEEVAPVDVEAAFWKQPPLLHVPDKYKVEEICRQLDRDMRGVPTLSAIVSLFCGLLKVPACQISQDHHDVLTFWQMCDDERVSFLRSSASKASLDEWYARLHPQPAASLLPHTPLFPKKCSKEKLLAILEATDVNQDNMIESKEAKHLFHRLLGVPKHQITPNHVELQQFLSLNRNEMAERLYSSSKVTAARVDAYYDRLFCVKAAVEVEALLESATDAGSLLHLPSRPKLAMIVEHFEQTADHHNLLEEARRLFSGLLAIPEHDIPEEHPELLAWCKMSLEERVETLFAGTTDTRVNRYFEVVFAGEDPDTHMSLGPNYKKVKELVDAMRSHGGDDAVVRSHDVKVLFSRLLDLPVAKIPNDHEGVLAFAGLTKEALVDKLCRCASASKIQQYHDAMLGPLPEWPAPSRSSGTGTDACPLLRPGMLPRWVPTPQGTSRPLHGGFVLNGVE